MKAGNETNNSDTHITLRLYFVKRTEIHLFQSTSSFEAAEFHSRVAVIIRKTFHFLPAA